MGNTKVLKIDADLDKVYEVQDFVNAELEAHDCNMKAQMQIEIAVEELFVNIAHYAYPEGKGDAEIRVSVEDGVASITFCDHGIPYNPLAREDPDVTLTAQERKIGGLGIYMVKKSMDDMLYEYTDQQNILTIKKKIS